MKDNDNSKVIHFPGNYSPPTEKEGELREVKIDSLRASVQYGDFTGTVAADDHDHRSLDTRGKARHQH